VCSPQGFNWYEDDQEMTSDINGMYNTREWGLKTMAYLNKIELHEQGDRRGVVARDADGTPCLMAFVWIDRD
jgi:hypothetical protein